MSPEELLAFGLPREIAVFIIAMLPVSELRGAIPAGINVFGMPWQQVFPLAIAGNLLPVPLLLLFFSSAYRILGRWKIFGSLFDWILERTKKRSGLVEKYERTGLLILVAIPLPFTGAWTGALAAVMLGIGFKKAIISIIAGVLIAGVIVTSLSLLGWTGAILVGIALVIIAVAGLWRA